MRNACSVCESAVGYILVQEPERTLFSRGSLTRVLRWGSLVALLSAVFAYGVGVGVFQWFPYGGIQALYSAASGGSFDAHPSPMGYGQVEGELLRFAFTRELSLPVLQEPAASLDDILAFNERIHTPVGLFFNAPDHIEIVGARQLDTLDEAPVLAVDFLFNGRERQAYAYGTLPVGDAVAVLMIPGSGENKARSIVSGDADDYHCCLYDALDGFDRFVQIKPNEGLRAIHDGEGRLHEDFFINWHLNRGSSYSAAYIVEAIALSQYLSERSDRHAVIGLSQGGAAALLTSLLASPDALVVASGYSVLSQEQVLAANHRQIIIPGVSSLTEPHELLARIDFPSLLTYGRGEGGTYGIEADTGRTCTVLADSKYVECIAHDGGHVFPTPEVLDFLNEALAPSGSRIQSPARFIPPELRRRHFSVTAPLFSSTLERRSDSLRPRRRDAHSPTALHSRQFG